MYLMNLMNLIVISIIYKIMNKVMFRMTYIDILIFKVHNVLIDIVFIFLINFSIIV